MNYKGNWPKNKKQWWKLVDEFWPQLLGLMNRWLGMTDNEDIDGNITECQRSEEIAKMKQERNPRLASYFQGTWMNAPDIAGLDEIPGWALLCDLCSESYVLEEENNMGEQGYDEGPEHLIATAYTENKPMKQVITDIQSVYPELSEKCLRLIWRSIDTFCNIKGIHYLIVEEDEKIDKIPEIKNRIIKELIKAVFNLGAKSDLLAITGSYQDTLTDKEILEMLNEWNTLFLREQLGDAP
jgi:hypothetical protein